MHDLDLVVVSDFRRIPVLFADDVFIEFDGDALFGKFEGVQKAGERGNAVEFASLAVDEDRHRTIFADRKNFVHRWTLMNTDFLFIKKLSVSIRVYRWTEIFRL